MKYAVSYFFLRLFLLPFALLSHRTIHQIGAFLGKVAFYLLPKHRKRTLSNLSIATDLTLSKKQLYNTAKASLGNLITTCLEYGKLSHTWEMSQLIIRHNTEKAKELLERGQGIIFFCGHQANWELFFLDGTSNMSPFQGVAIGQPIKNKRLYRWVVSIREQFGGKIIEPKEAIKEGLKALKQGKFLGIVGDQGMPQGGFSSPFLGRHAWTSPLPALLSYKSQAPIITATMQRINGQYHITYSDPIWPNPKKERQQEVVRLMQEALHPLEKSILHTPSQWLWQHNRWKQQILGRVKKQYRHDTIAIFLPRLPKIDLTSFRDVYPTETIVVFSPYPLDCPIGNETYTYEKDHQLFVQDYRFKLIFNFTGNKKIERHFLRLGAQKSVNPHQLSKEAKLPLSTPLCNLLPKALLHASETILSK